MCTFGNHAKVINSFFFQLKSSFCKLLRLNFSILLSIKICQQKIVLSIVDSLPPINAQVQIQSIIKIIRIHQLNLNLSSVSMFIENTRKKKRIASSISYFYIRKKDEFFFHVSEIIRLASHVLKHSIQFGANVKCI